MTKSQIDLVAKTLRSVRPAQGTPTYEQWLATVEQFRRSFYDTFENFKQAKFISDCNAA